MDYGDVTRALDIVAEEMSAPDRRSGLPFIIDYQTEEDQVIPDTVSTTIRAALRHWAKFHNLNKRVFNVARTTAKYGDCFFRKTSDTKQWEYIDPTRVMGVTINAQGEKLNYHIRPSNFQNTVSPPGLKATTTPDNIEVSPAAAIIHFTLSDDMGASAPFGLSILQSAFKDFQKLTMLEDAAIVFRIVRAPMRRVYYIDVGNMPPQKIRAYIEGVKNDLRQKRSPNTANADQADGSYNAESMLEDLYFPVSAAGRGSRAENLEGAANWEIPELDYFQNKVFRALRVPTSYMKGQDAASPGGVFNDGKVGLAYIEERIFANFVKRLQKCIEDIFDAEFKTYLRVTGINVDPELFKLTLSEPQNFAAYQQAALDADLINAFKSIEETPYLSKRFMLKRFLGLTEDELSINQQMLMQEHNIQEGLSVDVLQQVYDPQVYENREKVKVEDVEEEEPEDQGEPSAPPPSEEPAPAEEPAAS